MNLIKWKKQNNVSNEIANLNQWISDFFNESPDLFTQNCSINKGNPFLPEIDVIENDDRIEVKVDLPGFEKENIHVEFNANRLRITGERKTEEETKRNHYFKSERVFGRFERAVTLPKGVNAQNIKAVYKNGVLELTIPKTEESKVKQIKVN